MDLKKTSAPVNTITYNKSKLEEPTGNIYEAITIMSKRANQISKDLKEDYSFQREQELEAVTNAEVKQAILDNDIQLCNFADLP